MERLELEIVNDGEVLQLTETDALGQGQVRLRMRKVNTAFDVFPTDLLLEGLGRIPGEEVAEIIEWLKLQFLEEVMPKCRSTEPTAHVGNV